MNSNYQLLEIPWFYMKSRILNGMIKGYTKYKTKNINRGKDINF